MISVVIPNYNNSKYLSQCIDSVLNQTFQPSEIIIVDDCSTDSSVELIKKYAKKFSIIKGIYLEKNGGVSNARNVGIENATQEYITFLDSDDFYYSKDKLKNEMNLILNCNVEKVMVYSVTNNVNEQGKPFDNDPIFKPDYMIGDVRLNLLLLTRNIKFVPRDYCIKKSLLEEVGKYNFYKDYYEDLDLLFRLAYFGVQFLCTYEWGTAYRLKSYGLSHKSQKESQKTKTEIFYKYWKLTDKKTKMFFLLKSVKYRFLRW